MAGCLSSALLAVAAATLPPSIDEGAGAVPAAAPLSPFTNAGADPALATVELSDLREAPSTWLGRRVRLVVQMREPVETWQPWFTRFGPSDHVGWSGWSDDDFTWEPAVFHDPFARLFAPRGSLAERELASASLFERFELVATVREVFLGEPWIEVERARQLSDEVGEGTVLHAIRADLHRSAGRLELARDELVRAMAGQLPARARAELERLRDEVEQELAEPDRGARR